MRSTQRDLGNVIEFSARCPDAPSGSGVAQPGNIPFTYIRTATGQYTYRFDDRIRPIAVQTNADYQVANQSASALFSPGTFALATYNNGVVTNDAHSWTCTAIDKRT